MSDCLRAGEGMIRLSGLSDVMFARIASHMAMTDQVPLLRSVCVALAPELLPAGNGMLGTPPPPSPMGDPPSPGSCDC